MNQEQPLRPSMLIVIIAVIALAMMLIGRQRHLDWLIPVGPVLLGAVLLSPTGQFMQADDFRSRILGARIARQLGGRTFQVLFGAAVAAVGVCWWLLTLLMAALSAE